MTKWRFLFGTCAALLMPVCAGPALASGLPFFERSHQDGPQPDAEETGKIVAVDQASRMITLADGHHYRIPAWIQFDRLQQGVMISIVYTPNPHQNTTDVKTVTII